MPTHAAAGLWPLRTIAAIAQWLAVYRFFTCCPGHAGWFVVCPCRLETAPRNPPEGGVALGPTTYQKPLRPKFFQRRHISPPLKICFLPFIVSLEPCCVCFAELLFSQFSQANLEAIHQILIFLMHSISCFQARWQLNTWESCPFNAPFLSPYSCRGKLQSHTTYAHIWQGYCSRAHSRQESFMRSCPRDGPRTGWKRLTIQSCWKRPALLRASHKDTEKFEICIEGKTSSILALLSTKEGLVGPDADAHSSICGLKSLHCCVSRGHCLLPHTRHSLNPHPDEGWLLPASSLACDQSYTSTTDAPPRNAYRPSIVCTRI